MNPALTEKLKHLHDCLLDAIGPWNEADARTQLHPDLSPALWHVGHVAVIEAFWLREEILDEAIPQSWKILYFPENTPKAERSALLPNKTELLDLATRLFRENLDLLASLLETPQAQQLHALLRKDYIAHFLIQHCAQHLETVAQIAQHRSLRLDPHHTVRAPLIPVEARLPEIPCTGGEIAIGSCGDPWAYDNELPRHRVTLAAFRIGLNAISNAEYYGFMQSGGYDRREYWPEAAWRWRESNAVQAPEHWRQDKAGQWYVLTAEGPRDIEPEAPVEGISRYEAGAFAYYCGCRLPFEWEWESAAESRAILPESVSTWEWCENIFYPYPGFSAFPYQRYSVPWFDGSHFTLRGSSRYTDESLRRFTFRNFYTPGKRHIFAGLRLALDR